MYCKNCGEKLLDDAKFCGKCGESFSDDETKTVGVVKTKMNLFKKLCLLVLMYIEAGIVYYALKLGLGIILAWILVLSNASNNVELVSTLSSLVGVFSAVFGIYMAVQSYKKLKVKWKIK